MISFSFFVVARQGWSQEILWEGASQKKFRFFRIFYFKKYIIFVVCYERTTKIISQRMLMKACIQSFS
jgi:hypothetical protein